MTVCPACSAEIPGSGHFCPECGEAISSVSQLPTNLASPAAAEASRRRAFSSTPVGRLVSGDGIEAGGFTPGAILAERYRVIGLLGRGGMGEVYRADDLKLGQPVALKFLPRHLAADRARLERFYAEVRIARQVSHANVCRVYDVGEIDGLQYLSMEYVDGENLASLLNRIGRLPADKALEIARELCAGLAAAHEKGVLHRDLKPANIMIDGRGRARITDFGLAVAAGEDTRGEISGTPAYMAPEQLAGQGASARSDVYSLGLVLYELYTGRKAFDGATLGELKHKHAEEPPASPSTVSPGFDPVVERVILRCLEKDPAARPASASQIAAALPGGDPLAAAIAAGETPSPEMVAAAGQRGVIRPATARRLLLALAAALALAVFLSPQANIAAFVGGLEKSPEVLRERAREVLRGAGLEAKPADFANYFRTNFDFLRWARAHGALGGDLSRDAIGFGYRQALRPLAPADANNGPFPMPMVTESDPPPIEGGMAEVVVDPRGRLVRLAIVPPEREHEGTTPPPETDWGFLFGQAGLDVNRFTRVEPRWTPRGFATARAAWEGPHPERPGLTMRVEASSYRGRPVGFLWIGPWTRPSRDPEAMAALPAGGVVFLGLLTLFIFGGAILARHNVRAGRGDQRGAARLAAGVIVLVAAMWALGAHHVASADELLVFFNGLTNAFGVGLSFWIIYLALEPIARSRWPEMLISWTRALSGRWRDPLVGRDALIGALLGTTVGLIMGPLRVLIPLRFGLPGPPPHPFDDSAPVSPGLAVSWLISTGVLAVIWVLGIVFLLILARRVVRRGWLAGVLVAIIYTATYLGGSGASVTIPLALISMGILVATTVRFGVLAAIVAETCRRATGYFIYTRDPSSWYFYAGVLAVLGVLALAYWATRTALAGQPLFTGLALEERAAEAD